MTHEFKTIIETAYRDSKYKHVLATVVALDGSSYRKPGVQMLISENGTTTGAVSGGCVEKEVVLQAASVFNTGTPRIMTYDGRYRLGCEGMLYILLEPFEITEDSFKLLEHEFKFRHHFSVIAYFEKVESTSPDFGSVLVLNDGRRIAFRKNYSDITSKKTLECFTQNFTALNRLLIIGAEHDAVLLCKMSALLGWEVIVVATPNDSKSIDDFSGAHRVLHLNPEMSFDFSIDKETAVVLMNHNYARDLHFLLKLNNEHPFYIGILGSTSRRDKLLNALMEYNPDIALDVLERIHGPAGTDIGAITPQEIAISILSEIIAVKRDKQVKSLKNYLGSLHE